MGADQYDPLDFEGRKKAERDKALKEKLEREHEESDMKWLMGSKRGRRIVWRLLDQSGVFRSSFNPTAMVMAFNEGCRNFGNRTLALVQSACPELFPVMLKEHANGRSSDGPGGQSQAPDGPDAAPE